MIAEAIATGIAFALGLFTFLVALMILAGICGVILDLWGRLWN